MGIKKRDAKGRIRSNYDDLALYEVVAAVTSFADPCPDVVPQHVYDRERAAAGYPDAPSARAICMRLRSLTGERLSWYEIVTRATDPEGMKERQAIFHRGREEAADYMTERHVVFALNGAALHLGLSKDESLTPARYETARREMIELAARRRRKRQLAELLPTVGQVERIMRNAIARGSNTSIPFEEAIERGRWAPASPDGIWDRALKLAGLPVRPRGDISRALPAPLAVHHFVEANGLELWPSQLEIKRFGELAGIGIARWDGRWKDCIAAAKQHRDERGLRSPTRMKTTDPRRRVIQPPAAPIPGAVPRDRRRYITEEICINAIRTFLDELPPGVNPTQKRYLAASTGRDDMPAPRSFAQFGGWSQLLEKAREVARGAHLG